MMLNQNTGCEGAVQEGDEGWMFPGKAKRPAPRKLRKAGHFTAGRGTEDAVQGRAAVI